MTSILDLPEIRALDRGDSVVRIPDQQQVPLTPRVRRLIDTPAFRRLARVSQLGLVANVYPGAVHSRFEHALGVYRLALVYLRQLAADPRFAEQVTARDAQHIVVAALVHDIGHWPYCHPLEDLREPNIPPHEQLAEQRLQEPGLARLLAEDWQADAATVMALLRPAPSADARQSLLASLLSGPIDIDKMDYLYRDSLHAGVPYGMHFDRQRLVSSLCTNSAADGIALAEKGRTAAELMVFARYVMFSEVYWHHAVRAATAMLQRAVVELAPRLEFPRLFRMADQEFAAYLRERADGEPAATLVEGLFGERRRLYKRLREYDFHASPKLHAALARRPYRQLVAFSRRLADRLSSRLGAAIKPLDVLVDAPPVKLEVQFKVDVRMKNGTFQPLGDLSPIVHTLATRQFDDYVKRVRIFISPDVRIDPASRVIDETIEEELPAD